MAEVNIDMGQITTYVSSLLLPLFAYFGISAVTQNIYVLIISLSLIIGWSYLNLKYPRYADQLKELISEAKVIIDDSKKGGVE
ncbi:MAG: hypothetical protein K8E24_013555 [Methanobacterium paludis]|nr:hypothetical protein [Methanobacterium paludis]